MAKTYFENPFKKDLHLERFPQTTDASLQAWDSADELILNHLAQDPELSQKKLFILNDSFGALASALSDYHPEVYIDSFLSAEALSRNSKGQCKAEFKLHLPRGPFDCALLKVPKNLGFLEDELHVIASCLKEGGQLIAGSRIKYLPKAVFELIERTIGPCTTTLASKKSRLIFAQKTLKPSSNPYPKKVTLEGFAKPFVHPSLIFSREKLDIGTRFLLENFPKGAGGNTLDLGCGNGILGIAAKLQDPRAVIHFADESFMAIESAQTNYREYFSDEAYFYHGHGFKPKPRVEMDLVLCNPPFHQENTLDESVSTQMFQDAFETLRKGGQLWVVGNSHLAYGPRLKRQFERVKLCAQNAKFCVFTCTK